MKSFLNAYFLLHPDSEPEWVIYLLTITLAVIVLSRVLFPNNFESLGSIEKFQQVNDNQIFFGFSFQLVYAGLLSALFVNYLSNDFEFFLFTPVIKLIVLSILILLLFGLRKILARIGAFAFGISPDNDFIMKAFNYYRTFSVLVLWIAVFLFYFSGLNQLILLIITGSTILFIRGMSFVFIFKNRQNKETKNLYYNISYLCALEILPVLVFLKYISI